MARGTEGTYAIGEISRLVELSQRTIRYYEEIGLLHSVRRIENGKRVYTDNDVRRLKFINRLKVLGLSLAEMVELEKIYRKQRNNLEILPKLLANPRRACRADRRTRRPACDAEERDPGIPAAPAGQGAACRNPG